MRLVGVTLLGWWLLNGGIVRSCLDEMGALT